ncbi:MAG: VWA domain-containing protein [Vicinamibacteria bacterium]|nr:VWA domain-containing protein [Vicinamibacteria bacterium]
MTRFEPMLNGTIAKARRREGAKVFVVGLAGMLAVVAWLTTANRAQERAQQLPRFRAGASLVRVDAYPTLKGRAVTDLTAADFEVLEDGAPQRVESFELVQVRAGGPQETRREPNTVREAQAMAEDARARIFVIYLDTYFTDLAGSHRIQRSLVKLLDRVVGDDDLFAVMTPDMSARDLALARRSTTMEGYLSKYWFWGQRSRLYPEDPVEQRYLECFPERSGGRQCSMPGNNNAQVSEPENFYAGVANEMIQRRREKRVLDGLEDLARHLGGLRDERKAVITISNGWLLFTPNPSLARMAPCETPPGRGQVGTTPDGRITTDRMRSDYGYSKYDCDTDRQMLASLNNAQDYRDLMDVANANNVTFYPVDARGLAAFDRDISENPVMGPAAEIQMVRGRVESLRTLADNTDGLAVVDTNDLDKGFQRIVDDMTSYYLLGYYSTNTKLDGKVRKIKVRVKRDGVDVRARRSYRAATEEEIEQGTAQMTAAAAAAPASAVQVALNSIGSSRAGVPLRTAVSYAMVGGGAGRAHVWALAELDPGLLRGDEWLGGGEVDVLLQSADGTKIDQRTGTLPGGQRSLNLDLGEVTLPDGELVVRTRVKPSSGGLPVSDTIRLAISPDGGGPGVPVLLRRGPTTGIRYVPTADKQFRRTDRVRLELPSAEGVTATSAEVLDRSGKSMNIPVATAVRNDGTLTWATAEVALAPLAAGDYALRLKTERAGKSSEVVTGFRVIP